ncbi:hypothetical protein DPMN_030903 [Dreissena polymorpha]|uniref:Uncharacterized protein n=1 Tax=Dreissena polymorpha TaxID=45954 RepID=A0A9D4RII6_DREPO|nr:hypothetical protein DPMN_030903 [Dreissena polymorpha]
MLIGLFIGSQKFVAGMEHGREATCKRCMEEVTGRPGNPVVTIVDVWVSVVPSPEEILNPQNIVWEIKNNNCQTNCKLKDKMFKLFQQFLFLYQIISYLNECEVI